MTEPLINIYDKIYAVEYDKRMCEILNQKFSHENKVKVICKDILKFEFDKFANNKLDVFGNIPYYITGPIFLRLFKQKDRIRSIFITVQKEVARRIKASCGSKDFGFFSCLAQYFTELKHSFIIKRNSFMPAPKVDSCFLVLEVKKAGLKRTEEDEFFKIIRCAFNQRRKTILNALSAQFSKDTVLSGLKKCGIDPILRPEDIGLDLFCRLAKVMQLK